MAGKKKVQTGEIDTAKAVTVAPKIVAPVENQANEQFAAQMAEMQRALEQANALNAQFADALDNANKKAKDAGEKKDNTKPIPMNPRSFAKYVKNLKDKKPKIFNKKFDELVAKGKKFGITVTPIEDNGFEEEVFNTTV